MVPSPWRTGDDDVKKSETHVAQVELQPAGETLDAPIQLTPEQLEAVAAGFMSQPSGGGGSGATTGLYPSRPPIKMF
jgi:hypothetical protein